MNKRITSVGWVPILISTFILLFLSSSGAFAQENNRMNFSGDASLREGFQQDRQDAIRFRDMGLEGKMRAFEGLGRIEKVRFFEEMGFDERRVFFSELSPVERASLFASLSPSEQARIFEDLSRDERSALIQVMAPQDREAWSQRYPGQVEVPGRRPPEITPIESILSGRFPIDITRDLKQFGYDYFERDGARFGPVGHMPVGEDYVIGPGDSFTINLWGRTEAVYDVVVSRDGRINLPRVGTLNVGGLRFSDLKPYLLHKFRELYPDFEMSVTMGALRTMDVFLMGEAVHPGTYSVSALSTALTTLFQAGGPNKIGSLRDIRIMRGGDRVGSLDLYDFFIQGSRGGDMRLQPGDTVFVPVIGPVVGISGLVRRPAIYEMKGQQTLGQMIALAGGVLPVGHLQNIVVERVVGHERRVVRSFDLAPGELKAAEDLTLPLYDGDVVKVYPVHDRLQQVVYLEGHVKYPREHELKPDMRLLDLIPSYDVLLPEPYLEQAEVIRLQPPDLQPEIRIFDLGALLEGDESHNLPLQEQDRVVVHSRWDKKDPPEVTVRGSVREPGTYRLFDGMTVRDLIFRAGNLTESAYTQTATITRLVIRDKEHAETIKIEFPLKEALSGKDPMNIHLQRNDILQVRAIPEYAEALRRNVLLEGEFVFPGTYTFRRGERLADVVARAGGLTESAYPRGAVFEREYVKEVQRERLSQYIHRLEEDILGMGALSIEGSLDSDQAALLRQTLTTKQELLQKMRQTEPTGRMVVDLEMALTITSADDNLELRSGDRLVVAKRPDTVTVMGEVFNPTALFFQKGRTVRDYLNRVGGITKNAEKDEIYLVRADGTVVSRGQSGFFGMASWDGDNHRWTMGRFESLPLEPGDTIIVPRKVERYPWLRVVKDVTQIVYQIALAAGVWLTHF